MNRLHTLIVCVVVLLLSACGSTPTKSSSTASSPVATTSSSVAVGKPAPNLPKAGSGKGAYYKDDGPGDNPPPGLELTLDAEPKVEPYSSSGNKPYVVFGKTYVPMMDDKPFTQRGIGSWYGKKFHGQKTSSGELYDMYKMTAAHPTLPIPSYARITNLSNGKQVIVKINDRGPFHSNRIVDLSYTAALKLDYLGKGSSELLLERLLPSDIEKMAENKKNGVTQVAAVSSSTVAKAAPVVVPVTTPASTPVAVPVTTPVVAPVVVPAGTVATTAATAATSAATTTSDQARSDDLDMLISEKNQEADGQMVPVVATPAPSAPIVPADPSTISETVVPVVTTTPNPASGFYLQFGAFGLRSNAEATYTRLQSKLAALPTFEIVQQGTLYRLFSGPFATRDDANHALELAVNVGVPKPIIVQR